MVTIYTLIQAGVWVFPTNTSSGLQGLQPCESTIYFLFIYF